METKKRLMIFGLLLLFILSLSIVSAFSFSDYWNELTGNAVVCNGVFRNGTNACSAECGASSGCDGRSPSSQYKCDSGLIYDSSAEFLCVCSDSCQASLVDENEPVVPPTPSPSVNETNTTSNNTSPGSGTGGGGSSTTSINCTDTDGGKNYNVKGTTRKGTISIIDYCGGTNGNILYEHYCTSGGILYQNFNYICPSGCSNGACVQNTTTPTNETNTTIPSIPMNNTCYESDNGKNFYVKGTATKGTVSVIDYCSGNILYEHYCDLNGSLIQNFNYVCEKGCENGTCVRDCLDSDGGKNYYVRGITVAENIEVEDYCSGDTLYESYCDEEGYLYQNFNFECSNGCSNGSCILNESIEGLNEQGVCEGCFYEDKCVSYGERILENYCSLSKSLEKQALEDSNCENNYECNSNICTSGKCVKGSIIQRVVNWFKDVF